MSQLQDKTRIALPLFLFIMAAFIVEHRYYRLKHLFTGQTPANVNWNYYVDVDFLLIAFICVLFAWITLKIFFKILNPEKK